MQNRFLLLSTLMGAASVTARDIPSNVKNFYDSLKAKGACSNKLASGFYSNDEGPNSKSFFVFVQTCSNNSSLRVLR